MCDATRFLCFLALLGSIQALAQDRETVSIAQSALTEAEREEALERLQRELDDIDPATAEIMVPRGSLSYRYLDVDIRHVFPELSDNDYQASVCTNTVMGGTTSINYHSVLSENRLAIKAASYVERADGLYCGALETEELCYFESPDVHFRLIGGASFEEAADILTALTAPNETLERYHRGF